MDNETFTAYQALQKLNGRTGHMPDTSKIEELHDTTGLDKKICQRAFVIDCIEDDVLRIESLDDVSAVLRRMLHELI